MAVALWQFHKISVSMDDNVEVTRESFPTYKKWDFDSETNAKNVNQGWKF
jgi:hypothetical protein